MAFNETQKDQIRQYLGFAAGFYDSNHRLEGMLDKVGDNAVEKTGVEAIMAKIVLVEAAVAAGGTSALSRGALKRVEGDVEFFPVSGEDSGLAVDARGYGNILINRLAARFGFRRDELPSHYFGVGSPTNSEMALG